MQNNPVDVQIGENIRLKRLAKKLSQTDLGNLLAEPISQQQVAKYESGDSAMVAERLVDFARALGCDLVALFDGVQVNHG